MTGLVLYAVSTYISTSLILRAMSHSHKESRGVRKMSRVEPTLEEEEEEELEGGEEGE